MIGTRTQNGRGRIRSGEAHATFSSKRRFASAFVARWCAVQSVEVLDGVVSGPGGRADAADRATLNRTPYRSLSHR